MTNKSTDDFSGWVSVLIETADIVKVVSEYVTLTEINGRIWGCCPFHEEIIPSFTVSPERGIYKCFGCGKIGNAINFIMDIEHVSFDDACRLLAEKTGTELPDIEFVCDGEEKSEMSRDDGNCMEKACCFTGHRPDKCKGSENIIRTRLAEEIRKKAEERYDTFITGMAPCVDIWAAEEVLKLKSEKKI